MTRNLRLDQICDLFDEQIQTLVKQVTNSWYVGLTTREEADYGTAVDTDFLRQRWEQDVSKPYVGRIFNSVVYAEPVVYGKNLPPSWNGEYKPANVSGAIAGHPDLLGKEIASKEVPVLLRNITRKR